MERNCVLRLRWKKMNNGTRYEMNGNSTGPNNKEQRSIRRNNSRRLGNTAG